MRNLIRKLIKKPTFKKGDKVICIDDSGSANILKKGETYIIENNTFYVNNYEFVTMKNTGSFFNVDRFKNLKTERKEKLKKICQY